MKTIQRIYQGSALVQTNVLISPGLNANLETMPANGVAVAGFHYAGPEPSPHVWTVNGAASNETAALDTGTGLMVSELEVTAPQAGPIEVSVNGGPTLTVQAT